MKHRGLKFLFLLLSLALLVGLLSGMSAYAEDYPIWIGNTQVTSDNTSGQGWSYNNNTLTLDNFNYTANSDADVYVTTYTGCIFIDDSSDINEITIELKGENTLTNNINYGSGIFSHSALNFSGSGSLNASGAFTGIYSFSNITVNSGNITATGNNSTGVSGGVIEIRGGTVKANGKAGGIHSSIDTGNGIIITDGTVTADGGTNGRGLYSPMSSVKIDGGTVTASGGTGISSVLGELQINGGIVIASGSQTAIDCKVKNSIAGTGWTDAAGTQGQATIDESSAGQDLRELEYKKVQFPAAADSFTVTYKPGDEASLKDGIQPPQGYTVDGQNIVKTGVKGEYQIEGLDQYFNAPEGKVFDCWKDANGAEYRAPQKVNLTANLTLTAQWKKSGTDGGDSEGGGSGSYGDLVFNIPGADDSWEYVGGGYVPQRAYRVSLAPMQGGSAALGLTTGDSGTALNVYPTSAVYVFPNADPGYTLDKIVWSLIDGSASYDITEAKNFVMPAMDVVVYVTFRPVG